MGGDASAPPRRRSRKKVDQVNLGAISVPGIPSKVDPCWIYRTTTLQGVNPAALAKVSVGEELTVTTIIKRKIRSVVCSIPETGDIVGAITFTNIALLIDCIDKGSQYTANVDSVNGGRCDVTVQRQRS